jgi:alpha-D-xyloside xylohydrolase
MKLFFTASVISFSFFTSTSASFISRRIQYSIIINNDKSVVNNSVISVGSTNSSLTPIAAASGQITYKNINLQVVKVEVTTNSSFIGARFNTPTDELFYGVWEYPFSKQLTNTDVSFDFKGVGNSDGINWDNNRAPFFITTAKYGVYADTLDMGFFDFTTPGQAQFIFNTSSLTYYIIQPKSSGDYKSIIQEYTSLSARIEMPPDSGYGPEFWSDDFTTDFHGSVSNAQENYYDVINHLYYNKIQATSMFADSKCLYLLYGFHSLTRSGAIQNWKLVVWKLRF